MARRDSTRTPAAGAAGVVAQALVVGVLKVTRWRVRIPGYAGGRISMRNRSGEKGNYHG
jgi:hypothetical protein